MPSRQRSSGSLDDADDDINLLDDGNHHSIDVVVEEQSIPRGPIHRFVHSVLQQTLILIFKNLKYKWTKPFQTIGALTFPIQLVFTLWVMNHFIFRDPVQPSIYQPLTPLDRNSRIYLSNVNNRSLYVDHVNSILGDNAIVYYSGENTPIDYMKNYRNYFLDVDMKNGKILMINRTNLARKNQLQDFQNYMKVQQCINTAIYNTQPSTPKPLTVSSMSINTRTFPKGEYTHSAVYILVISFLYPIYFSISIMNYFIPNLVSIITEKQSKIKSYMILMGCSNTSYVLSYLITCLLEILVLVTLTSICLLIAGILEYVNIFLFMILFTCYLISGIPLLMIVASLFTDSKKAVTVAQLLFMALEFLWVAFRVVLPLVKPDLVYYLQYVFYLFSPVAFCDIIFNMTVKFELKKKYFSFSNFSDIYIAFIYILADIALYFVIAVIFDKVGSGQNQSVLDYVKQFFKSSTTRDEDNVELVSQSQIQVSHVSKTFTVSTDTKLISCFIPKTKTQVVLDDFSIEINRGEITCLLGRNGSGKTTLVSLICGILKPDQGDISVCGMDVKDSIDNIRSVLGICPQDDIIFPKLSVLDHLRIFAMLKTSNHPESILVNLKRMDSMIDEILEILEFTEHKFKMASVLSGGQKRKLAFAISIIGNPQILLLDETTTGMDVENRQLVWKLLQEYRRQGKIILLVSQSMEEAEKLGDMIHIIKNGKLEVSGNSLFLKNHYGIEYHLNVICDSDQSLEKLTSFFTERIHDSSKYSITEESNVGGSSTIEYKCSLANDLVPQFPSLLKEFCQKKEELGVSSFGFTQATLEQVFLKLYPEVD